MRGNIANKGPRDYVHAMEHYLQLCFAVVMATAWVPVNSGKLNILVASYSYYNMLVAVLSRF